MCIRDSNCDDVEQCQDEAVGNQLNAFSTCVTLILAMMGVTTRIKKKADSNIQKILGCVPDTIGVFTLGTALVQFGSGCASNMPSEVTVDGEVIQVNYYPGLGYFAYWFCWLMAVIRVTLHWIVPVPGGGKQSSLYSKFLNKTIEMRKSIGSPVNLSLIHI